MNMQEVLLRTKDPDYAPRINTPLEDEYLKPLPHQGTLRYYYVAALRSRASQGARVRGVVKMPSSPKPTSGLTTRGLCRELGLSQLVRKRK